LADVSLRLDHDWKTLANIDRFGIEFAPEVVQADGNVRNLAWRIWNAKQVLVSDAQENPHLEPCTSLTQTFRPPTVCRPPKEGLHPLDLEYA